MIYVLFNPLSDNSRGEQDARMWAEANLKGKPEFKSVIKLDFKGFFDALSKDDEVILCGGDGTVNRFINDMYGYDFKCKLFYAKCGSGNDFYNDVEQYEKDGKVEFTQFLKDLPLVTVNGIKARFINGIGYGIDGDCCVVADKIKEQDKDAKIDYSSIAVGLLLGTGKLPDGTKTVFDPRHCKVEADGKVYEFDNVWLAASMHGKFYGGHMMAAPGQDRLNNGGHCTLTVLSSKGRVPTLLRFPTFSSGKHDGKKFITHIVAKHVKVTFDSPCGLQIDGDVVKDVVSYTVDYDK